MQYNPNPPNSLPLQAFPTETQWVQFLVELFLEHCDTALQSKSRFDVFLCGGNTPAPVYKALTQQKLPWEKIFWWMGDERFVAPQDPRRNELMIQNQFANVWKNMAPRFHGWGNFSTPQQAKENMNTRLLSSFGAGDGPDFCFLGIGDDGHTASLFPESPALQEQQALATATSEEHLGTQRLTVTFPLLNRSELVCFVSRGPHKKALAKRVANADTALVAGRVHAKHHIVCWCEQL